MPAGFRVDAHKVNRESAGREVLDDPTERRPWGSGLRGLALDFGGRKRSGRRQKAVQGVE
jgi:hypothetical protein